jgi:hypothetical protein
LPLSIPNDSSLSNRALGLQWLHGDPSINPVPFATTNGRLVTIGPVVCTNRYVYDLFDDTKTTGTLQAGGPIMQLVTLP